MSNEGVRCPAIEDLDLVHNLIEQCMERHLTKTEAMNMILRDANIDPAFTARVWMQLEVENREFFETYYIRVALRQQIETFNQLLREQATLMQTITNGVASSPGSNESHITGNGSHISGNGSHVSENGSHVSGNGSQTSENRSHGSENGFHTPENRTYRPENGFNRPENGSHMQRFDDQVGSCYSAAERGHSTISQNLQPSLFSNIPDVFSDGMLMVQTPPLFDLSAPLKKSDFLQSTLHAQNPNSSELIQGLNEEIIRLQNHYPDSLYADVVGTQATFNCVGASSQTLNELLLGINGSSLGNFEQIPRNSCFSGLSTTYPNGLANYEKSGFATTTADSFLGLQNGMVIAEDTNGRISKN